MPGYAQHQALQNSLTQQHRGPRPQRRRIAISWRRAAAFQPEAGEAYDAAVPVCEKIVVVSSVGPGWFADFVTDTL
jgi:hypothetical protein